MTGKDRKPWLPDSRGRQIEFRSNATPEVGLKIVRCITRAMRGDKRLCRLFSRPHRAGHGEKRTGSDSMSSHKNNILKRARPCIRCPSSPGYAPMAHKTPSRLEAHCPHFACRYIIRTPKSQLKVSRRLPCLRPFALEAADWTCVRWISLRSPPQTA